MRYDRPTQERRAKRAERELAELGQRMLIEGVSQ